MKSLHEIVSGYLQRPEFLRWCNNPEEPRDWSGVAAFMGLSGKDANVDPAKRFDTMKKDVRDAIAWCKLNGSDYLTREPDPQDSPISVRDIENLRDFLLALSYRFPKHLRQPPGGDKPS